MKVEVEHSDETAENIKTGADLLVEALAEQDVDTVFGYPGGAVLPIYDALYRHESSFKHILCRHEQGLIHAAEGYARVSSKPGVVIATSGPGATNLITGITDAMMDSTADCRFYRAGFFESHRYRRISGSRCYWFNYTGNKT